MTGEDKKTLLATIAHKGLFLREEAFCIGGVPMAGTLSGVVVCVGIILVLVLLGSWKWIIAGPSFGVRGPWSAVILGVVLLAAMLYLLSQHGFAFSRR